MATLTKENLLKRIKGVRAALNDLEKAVNGEPFQWGNVDGEYKKEVLKRLDLHLMTRDGIERSSLELIDGENPIGTCFSRAGVSRMQLYLVETQTRRAKRRRDVP